MSHTTSVTSVVFTDIDALKLAVKELNAAGIDCTLVKDAKPRAYYADQAGMGVAEYALKIGGGCRYDVGFYYDKELKGYVARTDLFGGDVAQKLGSSARPGESVQQAALGKLYQGYAVHAATRQAAKQGYKVRRVVKPDGTIQLVMNV